MCLITLLILAQFQFSLKKILPIKGNKRIRSGYKIFINLHFFYGFNLQAKYPKKIETNKDTTGGITCPQIDIWPENKKFSKWTKAAAQSTILVTLFWFIATFEHFVYIL